MQKQGNNEWTVLEKQNFPCSVQHLQALFLQHQDLCFHTEYLEAEIWFWMIKFSCSINFWTQKVSTSRLPSQQDGQSRWEQQRSAVEKAVISCRNDKIEQQSVLLLKGRQVDPDIPQLKQNLLALIVASWANFKAAIACNIPQWCWFTDQVFRRLKGAPSEALCRLAHNRCETVQKGANRF